ncbi:MAG: diguanylate cyclase [Saccharospirillaceae bacterium]|nr:diguanylate cyclase [Pseudomonadales bacterium]NRB80394.1 diguanylate cyclase [Saccharospirillaceae bacterium]
MDKELIAILGFGLILFLLSSCAAIVLYVTLSNVIKNKTYVHYFIIMFVTLSFAMLSFVARAFVPMWLSIMLANFLMLTAIYALRCGLLWRNSKQIHLYRDGVAISHILLFTFINTVVLHLIFDSVYYRILFVMLNISAVLFWASKSIIVNVDQATPGEKQTRIGIFIAAGLILSLPIMNQFFSDPWYYSIFSLIIFALFIMLLLSITLNLVLSDTIETHYKNSITDILTGLYNRRYFMTQFLMAINLSRRYHSPMSILICDIDHFKLINDQYGHDDGDLALQSFAKMLKESVRDVDTVARYGGEEFIILMPRTPVEEAKFVAERIRSNTEHLTISTPTHNFAFSVSIGLSSGDGESEVQNYIKLADEALYDAKHEGRNRVCER